MVERKIKKVVITGPTGVVGCALCSELAAQGIDVYAVCRTGSARADKLPKDPHIFPVFCDMEKLQELPSLLPCDIDAFYHFAWSHTIGPGRNDVMAQTDNIRYTVEAVRVAKALGCKVFIGAGSQAEYGPVSTPLSPDTPCFPVNGYGIAKLCAGQMSRIEAEKLSIDHIWVRILSIYGPGDGPATMISSVISQLLSEKKPALTKGEQLWDYLFSADAATALRLAAEHGVSGRIYPLGSGKVMPLKNYVEILRDEINPALPLGFGEVPYGASQVSFLQADISSLHKDTGFEPQYSFKEGIKITIDKYKNQ